MGEAKLAVRSSVNPDLRVGDRIAATPKALNDLIAGKAAGERV